MNLKLKSYFILLIFFFSDLSQAFFLRAEFEVGENYQTENYSLSSLTKEKKDYSFQGWNISGGLSRSEIESASTQETNKYLTESLSLGFDFQLTSGFDLSLNASGSQTSQTSYKQTNLGGEVSYSRSYDEEKQWGVSYGFSESEIKQDFEFTILSQKFFREVKLAQYEYNLNFFWSPHGDYNFQVGHWYYEYSKNKEDLQQAFQSRFINNRAANVAFSIAGLPNARSTISISGYLGESWEARLGYTQTQLIAGDRIIGDTEMGASYFFGQWIWSLNVIQSYSESRTENLILIQLGYDWI
ncbi:MAG: hypothetical protein ACK5W9_00680 [Bdellovibrionales bacterium]